MRLLHISDFHLSQSLGEKANEILDRFYGTAEIDGIITANAKEKPFDVLIITGDIRNCRSGLSVKTSLQIIDKIAISSGIDDISKIHLVPGNHDLNREDSFIPHIEEARDRYDYENGYYSDESNTLPLLNSRFNDYFWNLCDNLYKENDPWRRRNENPHYSVQKGNTGFVFLNTSLCCLSYAEDGQLNIGRIYLKQHIDSIVKSGATHIFIVAHHPVQSFENREEKALQNLLSLYENTKFIWLCGHAHEYRACVRGRLLTFQAGSLTKYEDVIPNFVIYDFEDGVLCNRIFSYLPHLNTTSKPPGGWKRVYTEPEECCWLGAEG
ncbi:MAG: metallophosphoesterase [Peptococcaceae bacterium]|nr:metallophosphoesterase [Peptococcaceae bacterium]